MAELVVDGETGSVVERDDVDGLVVALERLRDGGLREKLGAAGRQRAQERYTVDHMARAYERLWEQVLAAPRTPRVRPPAPRP